MASHLLRNYYEMRKKPLFICGFYYEMLFLFKTKKQVRLVTSSEYLLINISYITFYIRQT